MQGNALQYAAFVPHDMPSLVNEVKHIVILEVLLCSVLLFRCPRSAAVPVALCICGDTRIVS
jgi:hypothetical protein